LVALRAIAAGRRIAVDVATTTGFMFILDMGVYGGSWWIPAQWRATFNPASVPGVSGGFRTRVSAPAPIVVERVLYRPGASGAAAAGIEETGPVLGPAFPEVPPLVGPPGLEAGPPSARPQPYTALVEAVPVGAMSEARAAGRISPEEQHIVEDVAARRGVVPVLAPARGTGVTPQATGTLPWTAGQLVMGRAQ
jgi:hypothetical protein